MSFLEWLELCYKAVGIGVGVITLYISISKLYKAKKSKIKRNASHDVPK